jgi:glycerol-3-phosphate O-acyltransferase
VTGAIPIRRNTKDPAYLVTLKAYVAEVLLRRDLLFYLEGGRSYSGELKPAKTGLLHAAMLATEAAPVVIPTAIAYDLVLEDHILAPQATRRRHHPFSREIAEMVRYAVGYQSRAFVTFGEPIPLSDHLTDSRRAALDLAHEIRTRIGLLYKVLPTAILAAVVRPSATRAELEERADALVSRLRAAGANLEVTSGRQAVEEGTRTLVSRQVLLVERGGRCRVRDRAVLRYYARTIQHLTLDAVTSHLRTH